LLGHRIPWRIGTPLALQKEMAVPRDRPFVAATPVGPVPTARRHWSARLAARAPAQNTGTHIRIALLPRDSCEVRDRIPEAPTTLRPRSILLPSCFAAAAGNKAAGTMQLTQSANALLPPPSGPPKSFPLFPSLNGVADVGRLAVRLRWAPCECHSRG